MKAGGRHGGWGAVDGGWWVEVVAGCGGGRAVARKHAMGVSFRMTSRIT